MIRELDRVVLTTNLRRHRLKRGDIGTVVLKHGSRGYEVEFMTLKGDTVAVVSLTSQQVRPIGQNELPHVRDFEAA